MRPPTQYFGSTLRDAALAYAAAGYQVFPLRGKLPHGNCPACEPRSPYYQPHRPVDCEHELCHGLYAATSDPQRVARWWARWPQANIGARVPSSLFVHDVDPRHHGHQRLAQLEREHGPCHQPASACRAATTTASTAGSCTPAALCPRAGLGEGLDVKTHAGYVLLPPSRHPATGQPYTWAEPTPPPPPAPGWLHRLLAPPPAAPARPAPWSP